MITLISASAAGESTVRGTRSEELIESKHEVAATLHHGWAELRVRRTVHNGGPRHDQALFWIEVPDSAVATGLRTLGSVGGRPQWFAGELMEAEKAAERYRELTGIGGYYPKDPALLSWRSRGLLALQVFPVAPKDDKTVEYTLLLPTEYRDGAHRLTLPGLGTQAVPAEITARSGVGSSVLSIDGKVTKLGSLRPGPSDTVELALAPKSGDPLGGELAVATAGDHKIVTRFSVEAAPRVATVPRGAHVVVALDASRSLTDELVEAEQAATAAYLSHFPDAKVEVLTFDRAVHRRYGSFVPVARARADATALPVELANGSAVELALLEADKLLAATPAGSARRVLLLTDTRVRTALTPERLRAAVGQSGAVAHVGWVQDGTPSLARDDEHAWAVAPRATGGLFWRLGAGDTPGGGPELRALLEELARPMRVDRLKLYSPDLPVGGREAPPERLDEGQGLSDLFLAERPMSWLRVEGELWSKPISRVFHADPAAGKRWAALVFGNDVSDGLSEPEMMTLAMHGGAVSPVTSYLAIEPGVRPSTEGLEYGSGEGFGAGRGTMPSVRMGMSGVSGRGPTLDRHAWLRDTLGPAWKACGGTADSAAVTFETTLVEVVDVTRVEIRGSTDPVLQRCLREAVWDLKLPVQFDDAWTSWSVDL